MTDYISRDAIMSQFADHVKQSNNSDFAQTPTWNEAVQIVEDNPAADVVARDCYDRLLAENDQLRKERPVRNGRWIEARGSWFTPGGDPVWECSECGKGMHVYGIEHGTYGSDVADGQWVACPNCGARMDKMLTIIPAEEGE